MAADRQIGSVAAESKRAKLYAFVVFLLVIASLPFLAGALLNLETSSSDVHPWFPDESAGRESFVLLEEIFGPEDYWLLSFDSQENSGRVADLAEELRQRNDELEISLLDRISTGEEFLDSLPEEVADKTREALRGVFYDREGERVSLLAQSSDFGFRNRHLVHELITEVESTLEGRPGELRITGPGFLGVMADKETRRTLIKVTPATFFLAAFLALFLIRNLKLAAIVMLASGLAAAGSIAVVHYSGQSLSHLLVVVPSLAQLLALSNAIHLAQYYQEALEQGDPKAWRTALRNGWGPTTAASVTTMIGFLSLQLSSMPVVRSFSTYGMLAVLLAMVVVLTVVPAGLILLKPKPRSGGWIESGVIPHLNLFTAKWKVAIIVLSSLLMAVSIYGVSLLKAEVRMETFFADHSTFRENYQWFESEFGPLQSCQVIGRFDPDLSFEEQFDEVRQLRFLLEGGEQPKSVFSAATFDGMFEMGRKLGGEESVREFEESMLEDRLIADHDRGRYWRITVYHEPVPDISSSAINREIEAAIRELRESDDSRGEWTITGAYQLFGSAQETLLKELLKTFFFAFVIITPLVMLFLRSFRLGSIALIGNIFPVLVLFGVMGLLHARIDIATMVIASIAFGIAVDDTMHFLTCLARGLREDGGNPKEAISAAYRKSGSAILKTTVVISVGMLAFVLSEFEPSRRFAFYTAVVLALAMLGDLVMIPALIRGPFSRFLNRISNAS